MPVNSFSFDAHGLVFRLPETTMGFETVLVPCARRHHAGMMAQFYTPSGARFG